MISDGILEKELRERFGVDSIVSHLDGNVVVTLKPEVFDHLLSYDHHHHDECYPAEVYEADMESEHESGYDIGYSKGYEDALGDIESLGEAQAATDDYNAGYDQALKDARAAGWDPSAAIP